MAVEFDRTARGYATHHAGLPDRLFERRKTWNIGLPGQSIIDLGTGTGTFARGFALGGCRVTGLDIGAHLIDAAKLLDTEAGVSIEYVVAPDERTGLPDSAYDAVCASTAWRWFNRDEAAQEAHRLLKPNGKVVVVTFAWVPLPWNVVEATEHLILKHNPSWSLGGATGFYSGTVTDLAVLGFTDIETFPFDVDVPYSHEAWRGRIRASARVGASLPDEEVSRFDDDLRKLLLHDFAQGPLQVFHRLFAIVCQRG